MLSSTLQPAESSGSLPQQANVLELLQVVGMPCNHAHVENSRKQLYHLKQLWPLQHNHFQLSAAVRHVISMSTSNVIRCSKVSNELH